MVDAFNQQIEKGNIKKAALIYNNYTKESMEYTILGYSFWEMQLRFMMQHEKSILQNYRKIYRAKERKS